MEMIMIVLCTERYGTRREMQDWKYAIIEQVILWVLPEVPASLLAGAYRRCRSNSGVLSEGSAERDDLGGCSRAYLELCLCWGWKSDCVGEQAREDSSRW
jgi:hypothetical protein